MKIRTDQMEALQQQQEAKAKPKTAEGSSFGDLLANVVDKSASTAASQAAVTTPGMRSMGLNPLLDIQAAEPVASATEAEQQVMDSIENVLDKWENYAQSLGADARGGSLKAAYGELETISQDVQELKQSMPGLEGRRPDLEGMVEELDILATTEQFKFNRGDYSE